MSREIKIETSYYILIHCDQYNHFVGYPFPYENYHYRRREVERQMKLTYLMFFIANCYYLN